MSQFTEDYELARGPIDGLRLARELTGNADLTADKYGRVPLGEGLGQLEEIVEERHGQTRRTGRWEWRPEGMGAKEPLTAAVARLTGVEGPESVALAASFARRFEADSMLVERDAATALDPVAATAALNKVDPGPADYSGFSDVGDGLRVHADGRFMYSGDDPSHPRSGDFVTLLAHRKGVTRLDALRECAKLAKKHPRPSGPAVQKVSEDERRKRAARTW